MKAQACTNKHEYQPVEKLLASLSELAGQKFMLSCGHRVTFNQYLANDLVIINGKTLTVLCTECAG